MLTTPLVNADPFNPGNTSDQVYAILPGYSSKYAPLIASNGAGNPNIGEQITIPAGVPGLAAGTYTLLPASYALQPGAFRIELEGTTITPSAPESLGGSVLGSGYLGVANAGVKDSLATQFILMSGQEVRSYSQYNETSYASFEVSQAAQFNGIRPRLPEDAGILDIQLAAPKADGTNTLSFQGTALLKGSSDSTATRHRRRGDRRHQLQQCH